jgi:hypothetical protein
MMKITFHGGNCCGIKTISGLTLAPKDILWTLEEKSKFVSDTDANGGVVSSADNFYSFARPKETAGERFDAYMDFLRQYRPQGLVEVAIVRETGGAIKDQKDDYCGSSYQEAWAPFLEERGFTMVNRFANSNSGNYVEVYHYVMKEEFNYVDKFVFYDDEEEDDEYCADYNYYGDECFYEE